MATPRIIAGRYEIVREVARGGMGIVYEAMHVVSRRHVALKVLFTDAFADDMSRARFLREVSAPARIRHEGIVEVFDAGFNDGDGAPFVAMELLEGHTLRDEFERFPRPPSRTLWLFEGLLAPVAAAHAAGIVHRDLKPENAFVTQYGGRELVKVLDFGLARTMGEEAGHQTRTGVSMGTPHYMAPEQAVSARDVTPAADVWALGAMLYEALSGRTPFSGLTPSAVVVEAVTQPHLALTHIVPSVPPALSALVDRCLAKEPAQRPADAGVMLRELVELRPAFGVAAVAPVGVGAAAPDPFFASHSVAAGLPQTAALALTPPPFASPLFTPEGGGASASAAASAIEPMPSGGGPIAHAPNETKSSGVWGIFVGAGLGLAFVLLVSAAIGGFYVMQHRSSGSAGPSPRPPPRVGDLALGDSQLHTGEYTDRYEFTWPEGTHVHLKLRSTQFDPYLIARPPAGQQLANDDAVTEVGETDAALDFQASPGGKWVVMATSHSPGETGRYELTVTTSAGM